MLLPGQSSRSLVCKQELRTNSSAVCPLNAGLVGDIRPLEAKKVGGDAALGWVFWSRNGLRDVGLSGGALSGMLNVAICGEGKL